MKTRCRNFYDTRKCLENYVKNVIHIKNNLLVVYNALTRCLLCINQPTNNEGLPLFSYVSN